MYVHDDFVGHLPRSKYSLMNHHYLSYQNLLQIKNSTHLFLPNIFKVEQLCPKCGISFPPDRILKGRSHTFPVFLFSLPHTRGNVDMELCYISQN